MSIVRLVFLIFYYLVFLATSSLMWGQTAGRTFFVGGGSSLVFDENTFVLEKSGMAMCSSTCTSGITRVQISTLSPPISSSDSFEICCSRTLTLNNPFPFPLATGIAYLTIDQGVSLSISNKMITVANLTNHGTLNCTRTSSSAGRLVVSNNFINTGTTNIDNIALQVGKSFTNSGTFNLDKINFLIKDSFTNSGMFDFKNMSTLFVFQSDKNMVIFNGGTFTNGENMVMRFQGRGSYQMSLPTLSDRMRNLRINCPQCTINQASLLMTEQFSIGNTAVNAIYNIMTTTASEKLDINANFTVHANAIGFRLNLNRGIIQLGSSSVPVTFAPNNGTFNGGSGTMILNGNFAPNSGTFNGGSGTMNLNGDFTPNSGTFNGGSGTMNLNGDFTPNSGTFNGGSGTINLDGDFTPNSGTFNGGSGTMNLDGDFAPTGGTFNAQTSTVSMDASINNRFINFSLSSSNSFSFYNLKVVNSSAINSSQSFFCDAREVITINNNLILTGSSASNLITFEKNASSVGGRCILNFKKAQSPSNFSNLKVIGIDSSGSDITAFPIIINASTTNVIDGGNNRGWFPLSGSLGSPVSLAITSAVASDQIGLDNIYNAQDFIEISFSNDTNFDVNSPNFNKTDIDNSFKFSQNLGSNYTGAWVDTRTIKIIIVDASGATPPSIGPLNVALKKELNSKIKQRFSTILLNIDTPISITGSFTHPDYEKNIGSDKKYTLRDVKIGPTIYRSSLDSVINFMKIPSNAQIEVRDITGRKVYSMTASNQNFKWHVRGNNGISLGSGVYFIYFVHKGQSRSMKFMVIH